MRPVERCTLCDAPAPVLYDVRCDNGYHACCEGCATLLGHRDLSHPVTTDAQSEVVTLPDKEATAAAWQAHCGTHSPERDV